MVNSQYWILGAVTAVGMGLLASNGMAAQGYYVGAEIGREHVLYQPEYSFVNGTPNESYDNKADGLGGGLLAGYLWQTGTAFSIAVQGRLSAGDAVWELDIPEPASFRYAIPVNGALSLLPTFQVSKRVALFVEVGVALGKIEERKSATATSMYDVGEWQPGGIAGAGVSFAVDDRWSVRIGYRRTWYKEFSYDTHLANGVRVETVSDQPVQGLTSIGLIREF